ncbi:hypothetical protein OS21_21020 [Dickeya oryzae]
MSLFFEPSAIDYPFPAKPRRLSEEEKQQYRHRIKHQLQARNAVLVAHYYTDPEIQSLAEETGGCVADSLEMARFGRTHPATTLVVAGVRFMGGNGKDTQPGKNRTDADARSGVLAGFRVPGRSLQRFLR